MSWDCIYIRRQLPLWVGGDLPDYEKRLLELHLRHCESCHQRALSHQHAYQALTGWAEEPDPPGAEAPAPLWPELRSAITAPAPVVTPSAASSFTPLAQRAMALAAGFALVSLIWFWNSGDPQPERASAPVMVQPKRGMPMQVRDDVRARPDTLFYHSGPEYYLNVGSPETYQGDM